MWKEEVTTIKKETFLTSLSLPPFPAIGSNALSDELLGLPFKQCNDAVFENEWATVIRMIRLNGTGNPSKWRGLLYLWEIKYKNLFSESAELCHCYCLQNLLRCSQLWLSGEDSLITSLMKLSVILLSADGGSSCCEYWLYYPKLLQRDETLELGQVFPSSF